MPSAKEADTTPMVSCGERNLVDGSHGGSVAVENDNILSNGRNSQRFSGVESGNELHADGSSLVKVEEDRASLPKDGGSSVKVEDAKAGNDKFAWPLPDQHVDQPTFSPQPTDRLEEILFRARLADLEILKKHHERIESLLGDSENRVVDAVKALVESLDVSALKGHKAPLDVAQGGIPGQTNTADMPRILQDFTAGQAPNQVPDGEDTFTSSQLQNRKSRNSIMTPSGSQSQNLIRKSALRKSVKGNSPTASSQGLKKPGPRTTVSIAEDSAQPENCSREPKPTGKVVLGTTEDGPRESCSGNQNPQGSAKYSIVSVEPPDSKGSGTGPFSGTGSMSSLTSDDNADSSRNTAHKNTIHDLQKQIKDIHKSILAPDNKRFTKVVSNAPVIKRDVQWFVTSPHFQHFVSALIIANSFCIGLQTDLEARNGESSEAFDHIETFFCLCFSIELVLQMVSQKKNFLFGKDNRWNAFDTFIVLAAIFEQIMQLLKRSGMPGLMSLRVLRILRLVRTIRIIRVLHCFRELRMVVSGIMNSLAALIWLVLVLILIMYIFAVYITQIVSDHITENEESISGDLRRRLLLLYGNIPVTLFTLYQSISGGNNWGVLVDPFIEMGQLVGPISALIFSMYITFSVFAVLNVVTGVFVGNAQKAQETDTDHQILEEINERSKHMTQVQQVFEAADADGSGELCWEEFEEAFADHRIRAYFRFLKLDIEGNGPDKLFKLFDFDGDGLIDIEEFITGCTKLKGVARSLDVALLHAEFKKQQKAMVAQHKAMGEIRTFIRQCQSGRPARTSSFQEPPPEPGQEEIC